MAKSNKNKQARIGGGGGGAPASPAGSSIQRGGASSSDRPRPAAAPRPRAKLFERQQKGKFRFLVLLGCTGYFAQKTFRPLLLPWGASVAVLPTLSGSIDYSNDRLQLQHGQTRKIVVPTTTTTNNNNKNDGVRVRGPETVVFGNDGTLYVLTEDATLVSLSTASSEKEESEDNDSNIVVNATATVVRDLGPGRPLGGKFVPRGAPNPFAAGSNRGNRGSNIDVETLYIADTLLGLTRIANVKDPKSKLEIVVRSVDVPNETSNNGAATTTVTSSPIVYADDVAVGPKTGRVYFTDASDIVPDLDRRNHWDTLYASKLDLMRGRPTGRLLQYDPFTDETAVLADRIHFANGVAVTADERYLVMAETFGVNLLRYDLQDGTVSTLVSADQLPGYLDGVDCVWWDTGKTFKNKPHMKNKCYAVMPSAIVPVHKLFNALPGPLSQVLRTLLMVLPRFLAPPVKSFGGLLEYDLVTGATKQYLDPTGRDIGMLTGVTVSPADGKLYLGSLQNKFVGVYEV